MEITFQLEGKVATALSEQTLLDVAHREGINIVATCGGKGQCKSCRVQIIQGTCSPPTDQEIQFLGEQELRRGFRLACQTKALQDAVIWITPPVLEESFQILSHTQKLRSSIASDIRKQHLFLPKMVEEKQSSDFEEIQQLLGTTLEQIDLDVLRQLPTIISQASREITAVFRDHHLIAVEAGDTSEQLYGIAFDIGTTTVVGYLLDLRTGSRLAVASELNAQTVYGGDVMSRITFAQRDPEGLQKLHRRILRTMVNIIDNVCEKAHTKHHQIYEVTVAGNTCMHHLFLNIDPVHLGLAPYLAAIRRRYVCRASDVGLNILPQARIVMLPLIASFVGSDTVGVVLATELHKSKESKLAIDIGTNGEIVLKTRDRLVACSTAAGTAFEGAQITHGMRGAVGAIDRVIIDTDVHCHVLGDGSALGICGSGLVDAVAQLLDAGFINVNGRFLSLSELEQAGLAPRLRERLVVKNRKKAFILVYGDQTSNGEPIVVTQQDIRELQLAKGAIAAGIEMLLRRCQLQEEDISEILLAGAFGNYLDPYSAVRIGLIPPLAHEKIRSVGNAAGLGAQIVLLSSQAKEEADQIGNTTEHIALTNTAEFQYAFAKAMGFPAKVPRR